MNETLIVIAALITTLLAAIFWKVALGRPFIHGYTRRQKTEAGKRVCEYLDTTNEWLYPSEIADLMNIDYNLCMESVERLYREGKIKIKSEEEEDIYKEKDMC